jgi:hypothetical protein
MDLISSDELARPEARAKPKKRAVKTVRRERMVKRLLDNATILI